MDWRIWNLGLYHNLFFCSLCSFVFKHILHVIALRTIYDLMSSVTTNMIGIPHMSLYFDLLHSNLKDYKNKVFLSFDSIGLNIMIFPMTICTIHSYFL
jgi:hypothetical protein